MRPHLLLALRVGAALVASSGAVAHATDGHITYVEPVGPSERPMVVAGSDRGVVFIDAQSHLFRAFHHTQTAIAGAVQPYLWVEDIDGDRRDEVVGAGLPSFVIDDNADPMWGVIDGCDQYFVGDFVDDTNKELLCIRGTSVRVWSYDGQEYFNWSGRGYSVTGCFGDDFDDDRKLEVACALSNGNHLMFDINAWYNDPSYDPPREGPAPEALNRGGVDYAAQAAIVAGERTLRVGQQNVTLAVSGGTVSFSADATPLGTAVVSGGVYSAAAADLDQDGTWEIYLGGDAVVHVVHLDGSVVATVPANPDATHRDARVAIRSVTANGLQDSSREAATAVVDGALSALT
ncbi:MAG: hypothetical protein H6700_05090, partial [Myxococcales bacterium]|nr:hypothetical protein [Myxococcales bacterium]